MIVLQYFVVLVKTTCVRVPVNSSLPERKIIYLVYNLWCHGLAMLLTYLFLMLVLLLTVFIIIIIVVIIILLQRLSVSSWVAYKPTFFSA